MERYETVYRNINLNIYTCLHSINTERFSITIQFIIQKKRAIYKILKAWIKNDAFCNMY